LAPLQDGTQQFHVRTWSAFGQKGSSTDQPRRKSGWVPDLCQ
jgi:hypothetical protein